MSAVVGVVAIVAVLVTLAANVNTIVTLPVSIRAS
jgi:hypothetical protein